MIIYTLDSETDPFLAGRTPRPFAWNLYNGTRHWTTWGANCTDEMLAILYNLPPGIVYLHNGGKFDIFFLLPAIDTDKEMLIIKERITQCYVKCRKGHHRLRDSVKILPFSLDTYQKTKIDYAKFEADVRDGYKDEIIDYLKDDCIFLFDLVKGYDEQFGLAITIGSTAIKELQRFHNIGELLTADVDARLRSKYFFGARVERYKTGVYKGDWQCYDVNSMYPFVMSNFYHPIGPPSFRGSHISENTFFVTVSGLSRGAFPIRTKTGVSFPHEVNTYSVSIHEYKTALELGLFDTHAILETVDFEYSNCFDNYINHYYELRKKARLESDKIREIFYKYLLNNSYGKFAINPENFKEYRITPDDWDLRWEGYPIEGSVLLPEFKLIIWSKPSKEAKYNNIATGASITGAARSVLMRGLANSEEPIYCDTDSIICKRLLASDIDVANLGAWKLEKTGDFVAIAGRKMYALYNQDECVKYACKGVRITPEDIVRAATGETITYVREAPTFRLNGSVDWITRRIRTV